VTGIGQIEWEESKQSGLRGCDSTNEPPSYEKKRAAMTATRFQFMFFG